MCRQPHVNERGKKYYNEEHIRRQKESIFYNTTKTTDEFRNVSVTATVNGSGRGWLGVVGVVDIHLV